MHVSPSGAQNQSSFFDGRISGDAPPGTRDGDLDMRIAEPEDDMSDEELARLNEALGQGFEQIKAGQFARQLM
jgi:hypothetical protein